MELELDGPTPQREFVPAAEIARITRREDNEQHISRERVETRPEPILPLVAPEDKKRIEADQGLGYRLAELILTSDTSTTDERVEAFLDHLRENEAQFDAHIGAFERGEAVPSSFHEAVGFLEAFEEVFGETDEAEEPGTIEPDTDRTS